MQELQTLLVTPYLFAACWMGYLAGYWYIMWTRTRRHEEAWITGLRGAVAKVYLPVQVLTIAAAAWLNSSLISPRLGEPAVLAARQVVKNLDGRRFLLTNGALDSVIQFVAHDAGVDLNLINTSNFHLAPYRRYLGKILQKPRLKSLIDVGLSQTLSEWARIDPDLHHKLAVLVNADVLVFDRADPGTGRGDVPGQGRTGRWPGEGCGARSRLLSEMIARLDAARRRTPAPGTH